MRTTLTLDTDLADRIAELAREQRRPFKEMLNETLRRGIRDSEMPEPVFVIETIAGTCRPGIDDRKLNEIAWE